MTTDPLRCKGYQTKALVLLSAVIRGADKHTEVDKEIEIKMFRYVSFDLLESSLP